MKKVYICSPYRGDTETNIQNAQNYCRAAVEQGCLPIAPHLFFPQFMDDDDLKEHESSMNMARELLFMCDEIWVFGKDYPTVGMKQEMNWAIGHMPVLDGFKMIGKSEKEKCSLEDISDDDLMDEFWKRIKAGHIVFGVETRNDGAHMAFKTRDGHKYES